MMQRPASLGTIVKGIDDGNFLLLFFDRGLFLSTASVFVAFSGHRNFPHHRKAVVASALLTAANIHSAFKTRVCQRSARCQEPAEKGKDTNPFFIVFRYPPRCFPVKRYRLLLSLSVPAAGPPLTLDCRCFNCTSTIPLNQQSGLPRAPSALLGRSESYRCNE